MSTDAQPEPKPQPRAPAMQPPGPAPTNDDIANDPIVRRAVEVFRGRVTAVERKPV